LPSIENTCDPFRNPFILSFHSASNFSRNVSAYNPIPLSEFLSAASSSGGANRTTLSGDEIKQLTTVELPKAVGAPGVPGDPHLILSVVNELYNLCLSFAQFEAAGERAAIAAKHVNGSCLRFSRLGRSDPPELGGEPLKISRRRFD
jgi:hypothetical protein